MGNILEHENGNYDGIAPWYDKWCTGDEAYLQSFKFYVKYLSDFEGPFLEMGIGTGRIALAIISEQNKRVTGVDISTNMLNECRRRYKELQTKSIVQGTLELIHGRFQDINFINEYQVAYFPFRTVGHILSDNELGEVFNKIYTALKAGGVFILDHYVFQKEWAILHNDIDIPMYNNKDEVIVDHYIYDFQEKRMLCYIKRNNIIVQSFTFRWIEPEVIKKIAICSGFKIEKVYGDFDGNELTPKSLNQIWVLRK